MTPQKPSRQLIIPVSFSKKEKGLPAVACGLMDGFHLSTTCHFCYDPVQRLPAKNFQPQFEAREVCRALQPVDLWPKCYCMLQSGKWVKLNTKAAAELPLAAPTNSMRNLRSQI